MPDDRRAQYKLVENVALNGSPEELSFQLFKQDEKLRRKLCIYFCAQLCYHYRFIIEFRSEPLVSGVRFDDTDSNFDADLIV